MLTIHYGPKQGLEQDQEQEKKQYTHQPCHEMNVSSPVPLIEKNQKTEEKGHRRPGTYSVEINMSRDGCCNLKLAPDAKCDETVRFDIRLVYDPDSIRDDEEFILEEDFPTIELVDPEGFWRSTDSYYSNDPDCRCKCECDCLPDPESESQYYSGLQYCDCLDCHGRGINLEINSKIFDSIRTVLKTTSFDMSNRCNWTIRMSEHDDKLIQERDRHGDVTGEAHYICGEIARKVEFESVSANDLGSDSDPEKEFIYEEPVLIFN